MHVGQGAGVDLVEVAVWHLPGEYALGGLPERAFIVRDPALVEVGGQQNAGHGDDDQRKAPFYLADDPRCL